MDTKKVVINKCIGGFSLSKEAVEELVKIDSELLSKYTVEEWADEDREGIVEKDGYVYMINCWDFADKNRDHPDLILVVEKLGDKANGNSANLEIVEIPNDINWYIDECHGEEWVAEDHRIWD